MSQKEYTIDTLATNADAQLVLKLYELRTEPGLREARRWVTGDFWPRTAEEFLAVFRSHGARENAYLRQVVSYWEMAAAFVLHGALDPSLFLACNGENFFIFAKFQPFLKEIREISPFFLSKTEELTLKFETARQRMFEVTRMLASHSFPKAGS